MLAPVNDKPGTVEDGVIEPVIDMVAAESQKIPNESALVILPLIVKFSPENHIGKAVMLAPPACVNTSPFIVKFPADCLMGELPAFDTDGHVEITLPLIIKFPAVAKIV